MRVVVIILLLSLSLIAGCKRGNNVTHPERKDITQAVYASGKLYPLNRYVVYSKLPGYVKAILVKVGDTVNINTPLIVVKNEVSELNTDAARNTLALAQKNADENGSLLMSIKQDVEVARSKYQLDSLNFYRYQNLLSKQAASQLQFDQAKTQFEISKQTYLRVFNNYTSTRDRVKTELANANIQYEAQMANRDEYSIVSAIKGRVYDILPHEGDLVSQQTQLMEIGDFVKYEVELSIDETDIALVKNGQVAYMTIDAMDGKTFHGVIKQTFPRINQANKTARVIADIDLPKGTEIYSGMSLEANIIIAEKKNILVVPREYFVDKNKLRINDKQELVSVEKGIEDLEYVEIISGVDESTEIIKP